MHPVAPLRLTMRKGRDLRSLGHVAQEYLMLDIAMLALGLGFFAAGIGYAYVCERL